MSFLRSRILGVGAYLPKCIMTNQELSQKVDTSDEWIVERTGIHTRCIADDLERTSDLAFFAAQKALKNANIDSNSIDAIIVATTTPDLTFPSTATKVQAKLNMKRGFAFDVQAVCSGFLYAMTVADSMIRAKQIKTALIIGSETLSRIVNWTDRNTCVLFGDGAGAVVLQAVQGDGSIYDRGVLCSKLFSDGNFGDLLQTDGGASSSEHVGKIQMNGKEVFRQAVSKLAGAAESILQEHNLTASDIDWFIPHQANIRIIDSTAKKLNIDKKKVIITVDHHANTSAASIPIALAESVEKGQVKVGDLLLLDAMGAGFTWGAMLLRF